MSLPTSARSSHRLFATPPATRAILLVLLGASLTMGCTPDEEKIQRMLQKHLDTCKATKDGEVMAEIKLFDGSTEPMLVEACSSPITELAIDSGVTATAKTGPYTWNISQHPDSGVWVASGVQWSDFHNALKILHDRDDPDAATYQGAVDQMASAEAAFPESAYVRARHLELLLKLRHKTRYKKGQTEEELTGLGKETQTYYDRLLTWASEQNQKDLANEARLMVIDYLGSYKRFLDDSLDTLGSRDDVLETSIKVAEKEGNTEDAEKYRTELETSRAERPKLQAELESRQQKVKDRRCKEIASLSADGIEDGDLKSRVVQLKGNTSECAPAAP